MPDHMEDLLKAAEDDENISKVLSTFQDEKSLQTNVDKIATFQTKILNATVEFLTAQKEIHPSAAKNLNTKKHNRVKNDIAYEITCFCLEITPASCKKCSNTFFPCEQTNDDQENVSCIVCQKSAHKPC